MSRRFVTQCVMDETWAERQIYNNDLWVVHRKNCLGGWPWSQKK